MKVSGFVSLLFYYAEHQVKFVEMIKLSLDVYFILFPSFGKI